MSKPKQENEPARMTLDELLRQKFSTLFASLLDTFSIFEEQLSQKNTKEDPNT